MARKIQIFGGKIPCFSREINFRERNLPFFLVPTYTWSQFPSYLANNFPGKWFHKPITSKKYTFVVAIFWTSGLMHSGWNIVWSHHFCCVTFSQPFLDITWSELNWLEIGFCNCWDLRRKLKWMIHSVLLSQHA